MLSWRNEFKSCVGAYYAQQATPRTIRGSPPLKPSKFDAATAFVTPSHVGCCGCIRIATTASTAVRATQPKRLQSQQTYPYDRCLSTLNLGPFGWSRFPCGSDDFNFSLYRETNGELRSLETVRAIVMSLVCGRLRNPWGTDARTCTAVVAPSLGVLASRSKHTKRTKYSKDSVP